MKSRATKLIAAAWMLFLTVSCFAQTSSLSVSAVVGVIDFSQSPATRGEDTNFVAEGKSSFLTPITVSNAVSFGPGRGTAQASGQAGKMRCLGTGHYDYFVPSITEGGYMEGKASVSVEDFVTVVSSTLPPGTIVDLSFKLSLHGTVSAPATDQARPGITADLWANVVAATLVAQQTKTLSHLQGTMGDVTFPVQAKVGETFRLLYSLEADIYLSSSIADYRDLSADGFTSDQGATFSITPQDPANVSFTAASGYDYGFAQPPTGRTDTNSPPFVTETAAELTSPLDADGDDNLDFIIVDKSTGVARLGLQQSDGSFQWADPVSTGLDNVTGLGIGHFSETGSSDGFAVAAPLWNRVAVFQDANGDSTLVPTVGIGPSMVVGINFAGDSRDDLAIGTIWDKSDIQTHFSGLAADASGFSLNFGPEDETGPLSLGNKTRLAPDGIWFVGALSDNNSAKNFVLKSVFTSAGQPDGPTLAGLPSDTEWVWGQFQTNDFARFLFYSPGTSNLFATAVQGSAPGPFLWTAGDHYQFDLPIDRITVVPVGSSALLLIVFDNGNSAATYAFDGNSAPVLRQSLAPSAGVKFSIGGALANGDFVMLSGQNGGRGASSSWQHWGFDGAQHKVVASGSLPSLNISQSRANILLFESNPDLDPNAPLLQMLHVGEWSDSASIIGANLHVAREQFLGASSGLGAQGFTDVPISLPTYFPAVNQRALPDSVAILTPPTKSAFSDLIFSPPSGSYQLNSGAALQIRISSDSGDAVQFRTNSSGTWTPYDPLNPPQITSSANFQAFVDSVFPGPIRSANYLIADAPAAVLPTTVDANHNGLPDSWEQTFGIKDPNGDADGDGFTNLQEYLGGSDPLDAASRPSTDVGNLVLVARAPGPNAPAGTQCEIAWPDSGTPLFLESTADIGNPASWSPAGGSDVSVGSERVHFEASGGATAARYFRLRTNQ